MKSFLEYINEARRYTNNNIYRVTALSQNIRAIPGVNDIEVVKEDDSNTYLTITYNGIEFPFIFNWAKFTFKFDTSDISFTVDANRETHHLISELTKIKDNIKSDYLSYK